MYCTTRKDPWNILTQCLREASDVFTAGFLPEESAGDEETIKRAIFKFQDRMGRNVSFAPKEVYDNMTFAELFRICERPNYRASESTVGEGE